MCTEVHSISLHQIHAESVRLMKKELQQLGFTINNWVRGYRYEMFRKVINKGI
jgi:hypothetical protein